MIHDVFLIISLHIIYIYGSYLGEGIWNTSGWMRSTFKFSHMILASFTFRICLSWAAKIHTNWKHIYQSLISYRLSCSNVNLIEIKLLLYYYMFNILQNPVQGHLRVIFRIANVITAVEILAGTSDVWDFFHQWIYILEAPRVIIKVKAKCMCQL